jgi:hypothetical protein
VDRFADRPQLIRIVRHKNVLLKIHNSSCPLVLLFACSDSRPGLEEAEKKFRALYANAEVIGIRVTDDEVVARSFRFRHQKGGEETVKEIEIQFMENSKTEIGSPFLLRKVKGGRTKLSI